MKENYMDGGFCSTTGVTSAGERGVVINSPIPKSYNKASKKKLEEIMPSDSPQVLEWKRRMKTEEVKKKNRNRAATVEQAIALLRNRGLYRFLVRGIRKAE